MFEYFIWHEVVIGLIIQKLLISQKLPFPNWFLSIPNCLQPFFEDQGFLFWTLILNPTYSSSNSNDKGQPPRVPWIKDFHTLRTTLIDQ